MSTFTVPLSKYRPSILCDPTNKIKRYSNPTYLEYWLKIYGVLRSRVKVVIFRAVKSKKKLKGHRVDNSGRAHYRRRSPYKQPGAQAITIPESPRANAHEISSLDLFVSQSPVQIF
jgi:hypothetical protein